MTVQILDTRATMETIEAERKRRALRVREAMLAWLRAFEELEDLPRSIPTSRERGEHREKQG